MEVGREAQRCGMAWRGSGSGRMDSPTSHLVDKNQKGYLGSKQSQPQARPQSPGSQLQEDKSPQLLAVKISVGLGQ